MKEHKNISIKKNVLFNILLRVANLAFPLITLPYIYRVLNIIDVGRIEFSISFVQYFIILSQLGIPTYGIRECSKYKSDENKFIKTAQEIILINILTSVISFIILLSLLNTIDSLNNYRELILIYGFNIFFINSGIEWFFQALEEYKYITVRAIIVKIISTILIFVIINSPSDYLFYSLIIVISNLLNSSINLFSAVKRYRIHKYLGKYNIKKHLKIILILSAISLSIVVYTNVDKTMLAFYSGDRSVGLYAVSYKIINVVLSIITALGMVLLPRLSHYVTNGLVSDAKKIIDNSLRVVQMFSIPATFGILAMAQSIVLIMSGDQYLAANITLRILAPLLIINGLANITGIALYSFGKERITLGSTIVGALINITINAILIPIFSYNGAAVATIIAEILVLAFQILCLRKLLDIKVNTDNSYKYFFGGFLVFLTCRIILSFSIPWLLQIVLSITLSIFIYFTYLLLMKDKYLLEMHERIFNKQRRKK